MSEIDLKTISVQELETHIQNTNQNPNIFLKDAIELNRIEIVKSLMEYGASLLSIGENEKLENYLESLPKEISEYLYLYNISGDYDHFKDDLDMMITQLSQNLLKIDSYNNTIRGRRFTDEDKINHWSIGLIRREHDDKRLINLLQDICDTYDWEDRFSNINPKEQKGFYLLTALSDDWYDYDSGSDDKTPNITGRFHIYLIPAYQLIQFLGKLTFDGFIKIIGINHLNESTIFKLGGEIDCRISSRLKEAACHYDQIIRRDNNTDPEKLTDLSLSNKSIEDFGSYEENSGDLSMGGEWYGNLFSDLLQDYNSGLIDSVEWLRISVHKCMPINWFQDECKRMFGTHWRRRTKKIIRDFFPEMLPRLEIMQSTPPLSTQGDDGGGWQAILDEPQISTKEMRRIFSAEYIEVIERASSQNNAKPDQQMSEEERIAKIKKLRARLKSRGIDLDAMEMSDSGSQNTSDDRSDNQVIIRKTVYVFHDIAHWDDELNRAAISFKSQNGFWPTIMQASSQTYRKIELVANSKPNKIRGDGSSGLPINPDGFVELSGFQGEEYALDMCLDEELPENSFRLIFDSDPDGEFDVEPEEYNKAV